MKPILFVDFDGTICHEQYWRSLPEVEHRRVQRLLFGDDTKMVHDWMRGHYTAEEVNEYVSIKLGLDYDYLWKLFVDDCKTMHVSTDILNDIKALGDRYTTILITGNMDSFTRFTMPALSLEEYFDEISNSFHEGRHKTDENGSLFYKFTDKYNVQISDCVLLDDSDKVCNIFTELGGKALKVTSDIPVEKHLLSLTRL
jgi:FMN phosphatase YigB (HAD superfamily)